MTKICFFSGTRAEYGLLKPLIRALKKEVNIVVKLIVSGMHMSPEFGLTYKEIENDGFEIDEKVEILLSSDTSIGICKSIGLGLISISESLQRIKPDILIILGDRFESLSAACAAMISRIPIVHLHGGEATYGLIDESIRHSITKMSHLHFTSTEDYKNRVIQLGESPDWVFNVGAIGIDNIKNMNLLSKEDLENKLKIKFKRKNLLVTFHPVTLEDNTSERQFRNLLDAFDKIDKTLIIFTKANSDTNGRIINKMIDNYVINNSDKAVSFMTLGQLNYLSIMQYIDAVVGNSSSGIIEAPSFKIGTINIGNRQKGRIKAESILDCEPEVEDIINSLKKLYSENFQKILKTLTNPNGDGNTTDRIINILKNKINKINYVKEFYDVQFDHKEYFHAY
jgi:GDP/UDP-N,N'-diacetylbacillosamine 2-epimerase (hydrolysing)